MLLCLLWVSGESNIDRKWYWMLRCLLWVSGEGNIERNWYWMLLCLLWGSGDNSIETLLTVTVNSVPDPLGYQQIQSLRSTYIHYFSKLHKFSPLVTNDNFSPFVGWWLLVCCVTAGDLWVFVVILVACFNTVSLLNHILFILLYMSFYLKYTFTSYYFVVLQKKTDVVKTLPIAHVT
jgi:hypothetical protein